MFPALLQRILLPGSALDAGTWRSGRPSKRMVVPSLIVGVTGACLTACDGTSEPAPAGASCRSGEVLDGEVCVPEACGVGTWGNLPVGETTVYVDAGAADGGDGSEAGPLHSVQEGVDLAGGQGGGLVAVAAGTYVEVIAMSDEHRDVTLAGRCLDLVVIDGSEGDGRDEVPTVEIIGDRKRPEIAMQGLTIAGGTYTGLWVQQATLTLTASVVRDNSPLGVIIGDGEVTMESVSVVGTLPDQRGDYGRGVDVEAGSLLTATNCTFSGNTEGALVAANDGTSVELVATTISDTMPSPDGSGGRGLNIQDGAQVSVTGCTLQGNADVAVFASSGATVDLDDTLILDTRPSGDGGGGQGLNVTDGATLTATNCTLQGNAEAGVFVEAVGTSVNLIDTDVLDTAPLADGTGGLGIAVSEGASLSATGCTIEGSSMVAVLVANEGTIVTLVNTQVLDTLPNDDGTGGRGIDIEDGANLTATGCTVRGNAEYGLVAMDEGTRIELVDTQILETNPGLDEEDGGGMSVQTGAHVSATGCTLQGNTKVGVYGSGAGTSVELSNTLILGTVPGPAGEDGRGVSFQEGAVLVMTGCTVQGNADVGVFADGLGTAVDLVDTEISENVPLNALGSGEGMVVQNFATANATGCTVRANTAVGVDVKDGGFVELVNTEVLDTLPESAGNAGFGVQVFRGGALVAYGCTIQGNTADGVIVEGEGSTVDLTDTSILDTVPSAGGGSGHGVTVQAGALLTAAGCLIDGNGEVGVMGDGEGTILELNETRIVGTLRGRVQAFALGLAAQASAIIRAVDCEISGTEGPGVYVVSGGAVELDGALITGNQLAGVVVASGSLTLAESTVSDTVPDADWGGGFGIYATDHFGPATLLVTDSTVGPHDYAAVWLDGNGMFDIQRTALSGSAGVDQGGSTIHGNALFAENGVTAWDGAAGLHLAGNSISGSAKIGVLLSASSASLEGNSWAENGVDLQQQSCDGIVAITEEEPDWSADWSVCPAGNALTAYDLEFTSLFLPTDSTAE